MSKEGSGKKENFKEIFKDGWEAFKAGHPRYEGVDEVVQKMLGCGEYEKGYAVYICPECLEKKKVPFSCKSSFCLGCAKTYTANWVETVQGMLHEGVKYRHLILTLSGSKIYQANGTPPNLLDKTKIGLKQKDLCGIPWRSAFALQADGWYLRSEVIWHKPNPMPESVTDRPTKAHEQIFLLTKSARYWYDQEAIREPQVTQSLDEAQKRAGKGGAQYDKWEDKNGFRGLGGLNRDTKNYNPAGRNCRTVWSIATTPYKKAHFATFSPKVVEPCILAGCPSQVCVECGEPWMKIIEKISKSIPIKERHGRTGHNGQPPQISGHYWDGPTTKASNVFTPTCQCNALHHPGIVLDPFFGAGTVGVVAKQLKRNFIGIELNSDYVEMARDRLDQIQPALFAMT